ncbi:MAG: cytidine deaminase [Planctomycetota bacterium]
MAELSASHRQELIRRCVEIRTNAHAPYSKFSVGASLLTYDNKYFDGVNVENASYGLTICAERSAIASAVSAGYKTGDFVAVAVATEGGHSPCGACRQVLVEFGPELIVLLVDTANPDDAEVTTMRELLPRMFQFPDRS